MQGGPIYRGHWLLRPNKVIDPWGCLVLAGLGRQSALSPQGAASLNWEPAVHAWGMHSSTCLLWFTTVF